MSSPLVWIAAGISSIGMLCLLFFAIPLEAPPTPISIRQQRLVALSAAPVEATTFTPPHKLASRFAKLANQSAALPPAVITITVQTTPASRQDFRFHGDLGDFQLDQAEPDDGDAIGQTKTFTVTPGLYAVETETPLTWQLSAIDCTAGSQLNLQLIRGQAKLLLQAGDQLRCTFVHQRGVTIRTRSYHDTNGDRTPTPGEPYLRDEIILIYKDQNILLSSQVTNQHGKANFNYLPAGSYAACTVPQTGWRNSQPGVIETAYGSPCYTFALNAGEVATLWFGHQQGNDPVPPIPPTGPHALTIVQGNDVTSHDDGYDDWSLVDADMNQAEPSLSLFLPLASTQ
ncbi:MAG: hypothetical protein KF832_17480 [Caldilineaceae bacterium]|nr:hypothetical protein [Caldilineaceae bacterium]